MTTRTIFDSHLHVWVRDMIPVPLRMSWAQSAALKRGDGSTAADIFPSVSAGIEDPHGTHLTRAMDTAGVSTGLILGVDYGALGGEPAKISAAVGQRMHQQICNASNGRLAYAVGIDPTNPDAIRLAETALDDPMCRGIKFYPPAGFTPDDPRCMPLYKLLDATDKAAVFHTAASRGRLAWRNGWPVHIATVQAEFPALRIVVAHAGFPCWWDECVALASVHQRTYLELSLWQREALPRPALFRERLDRAALLAGVDRLVFGSDTMFGERLDGVNELTQWAAWFDALSTDGLFTESEVDGIMAGNGQAAYW